MVFVYPGKLLFKVFFSQVTRILNNEKNLFKISRRSRFKHLLHKNIKFQNILTTDKISCVADIFYKFHQKRNINNYYNRKNEFCSKQERITFLLNTKAIVAELKIC